MRLKLQYCLFILFGLFSLKISAQDVSLYEQFNGRYDFIFVGNTMNPAENNQVNFCTVPTISSADLNLPPGNEVQSAFLYWAGSGTGDFNVRLNGLDITPQRTFSKTQISTDNRPRPFFCAFTDVTSIVSATGNGTYTLSDLDVNANITLYCSNRTNFAGWAIVIVYKNDLLPVNQLNIYDGLQSIPENIIISLSDLNVINTTGAQIGFVAWEGDQGLSDGETLSVNDHILSNLPLNPETNAFNGTNTFTQSDSLYNMDLDVYDIADYVHPGDQSATIKLSSSADYVMISTIVTKLNNNLPDATIVISNVVSSCGSRQIVVDYTVSNLNSTKELPAHVPVSFFADGRFIQTTFTLIPIPIGGHENGQIILTLPDDLPDDFMLKAVADDNGSGNGTVTEINETNNGFELPATLLPLPEFNIVQGPNACNEGFTKGTFDFSGYADLIRIDPADRISFYPTREDAENQTNAIANTSHYNAASSQEIFVRIDKGVCHTVTSFALVVKNCPPTVYNYISANNDGLNDYFYIKGLRDIFVNFKLSVYNRWGKLLWTGNNNSPDWDGDAVKGLVVSGGRVPDGTYFYILELNDPDYPQPLNGYLYFDK
ncbi:gliding motility-associated C-terminal domain-containing protein [Flavobacterium noncentrifugens]|uniref:gliding motility-associated C-terminal domain-containing protein n=1 Tax=Flavobacterium noncentrifugens TaxID=1128970 RepID=UPI001FDF3C2B|nr:gliding motility-associated C-terminal domain-containing protein [Flavobacterium noncentrifugens]